MNRKRFEITFFIERLSSGGAERVTALLANEFKKKGFNVNIIVLEKSEQEYLVLENVNKIYLNLEHNKNKLKRIIETSRKVCSLVKSLKSDVVISLATPVNNILLIPILISSKVKVILSERNDPKSFPSSHVIRFIRKYLYKLSNKVVFQTTYAKEFFPKDIQKKSSIIPNPIKDDLPERYGGKRKKEIVTYCRLAPQKNLNLLIDAFTILLKDFPEYKLVIYGEGPLKNELKEYAENKLRDKKNSILFKGYKNNLHKEIVDSKMFVSSSNYEGISNSMLESLAIGLPTICTDCPAYGARTFIKPYINGILVPVNDTQSLYKAMKELIEDEDLCEKLSNNSVEIRKKLSIDSIYMKWLRLIEEVL